MRKKISVIRHIGVLLLTIMIFTVGIFIGTSVEQARVENLYDQISEQSLEYQNLITETNYLNYLIENNDNDNNNIFINSTNVENNLSIINCNMIKQTYYSSLLNLDNSRLKLENYINQGKVESDEFRRLKAYYFNLEIDYWMIANKMNSICNSNFNSILYFYGDKKKCPSCEDQGVHLDYVKQKLKDDILIFSLDSEREGPINLLIKQYKVNERELPVLIINNKIYSFKTNSEIFKILNN